MNNKFEENYMKSNTEDRLLEMAKVANIQKNQMGLKQGMTIIIYTSNYKGSGEEPNFHLFPYISENIPNKSDLITRVKITQNIPKDTNDIVSIDGNPEVPTEYKEVILEWAKTSNKLGNNNWKFLQYMWNLNQNEEVFSL